MVHGSDAPQGICEGKKCTSKRPDAVTLQPVLPEFSFLTCCGIYGGQGVLLMALSDALSSRLLYLEHMQLQVPRREINILSYFKILSYFITCLVACRDVWGMSAQFTGSSVGCYNLVKRKKKRRAFTLQFLLILSFLKDLL